MERQRGSYRTRRAPEPQRSWFHDFKEWIRKTVAFLFGHVGICALVVGYIIMGAFAFMAIEADDALAPYEDVIRLRQDTVQRLWSITDRLNVLDKDNWTVAVGEEVRSYQEQIVAAIMDGYDGKNYTSPETDQDGNKTGNQWSFSGAFLYCLTVITTIGYGNITPHTMAGKLVTILYAMVGMPLFLLYVSNMGDFLATGFRWGYVKLCKCDFGARRRRHRRAAVAAAAAAAAAAVAAAHPPMSPTSAGSFPFGESAKGVAHSRGRAKHEPSDHHKHVDEHFELQPVGHYAMEGGAFDDDEEDKAADYQTATVPITISLTVMVSYVCGGAMLFGQWEDWDFLDGSYFCFISLSTTGFGDLVPGDSVFSSNGVELSLIFCSMYLIIGMALIAMCFNLMQEEVIAKMRRCGQILGCLRDP